MATLKHIDFEVPGFGELARTPVQVPAYRDAVMAMSPLAYWRLGEPTGATLANETGGHPLLISGAYSLAQEGAIQNDTDGAIFFTGATAQHQGPVLPQAANAPFSITFWMRVPPGPIHNGAFLGQYTGATDGEARLHITSAGALRFSMLNQYDLFTTQTIGTAWRHAAFVRSGTGVAYWYLDGALDVSSSGAGDPIPQPDFKIGTIASGIPRFSIDELAILDQALSPEQARWLHGLGRAQLALPPGT